MTTVKNEIPDQLWQQAQYMIQQGWVANMDELIAESMRRYLESHLETMNERFIRVGPAWSRLARSSLPTRDYSFIWMNWLVSIFWPILARLLYPKRFAETAASSSAGNGIITNAVCSAKPANVFPIGQGAEATLHLAYR
ncbi:hypothetical protein QZJ86_19705 [Methylomonas montana]|uniref:hypothetical protein n=1 Tax=Methylomonas montana TaxID=3058963 RepID=UPI0026592674|nr:hypothetical protein [Methylomonas montana]WKJ90212.1 hypothetical protein QZJ86_19705 [Methylomonas montana]